MNLFDLVVAKKLAGSGGGGGSSDISTAEVTVISDGEPAIELFGIVDDVSEIESLSQPFLAVRECDYALSEGTHILTVVLYQGHALFVTDSRNTVLSGNIQFLEAIDSDWKAYDITGDCTLTIGMGN